MGQEGENRRPKYTVPKLSSSESKRTILLFHRLVVCPHETSMVLPLPHTHSRLFIPLQTVLLQQLLMAHPFLPANAGEPGGVPADVPMQAVEEGGDSPPPCSLRRTPQRKWLRPRRMVGIGCTRTMDLPLCFRQSGARAARKTVFSSTT